MKVTRAHETRSPRMFWMESPVKDLWKFCPDWIHKWFIYSSFVSYFVTSALIENQEYWQPLVFCSFSQIEIKYFPDSVPITRNLTELQALTDVFSRSSRIVPDPLKHKFRVAWRWFLSNPKRDFDMVLLPMISQTSSSPTARRNPYTCQNISKRLCFVLFLFFKCFPLQIFSCPYKSEGWDAPHPGLALEDTPPQQKTQSSPKI